MKKHSKHFKARMGEDPNFILVTNMWKKMFIALFFISVMQSFSQNEGSKWHFGNYAGLDFMTNPPTIIPAVALNTAEGSASIADAAGNTLFYTDGVTVYNKNNFIMANGTGLLGNSSTTQSSLIVKKPANATIYYVFTLDDVAGQDGLCYSTVDIGLVAGTGSVISKNIQLHTPSCEKLTAVKHCNGTDIWVISHDYGSNAFRSYLVTAAGIMTTSPVISNAGTTINSTDKTVGQMKISPNGRKLGLAVYDLFSLQPYEIYDFDPATGVVSNPMVLLNSFENYGCEFSPDGTKFYGSSYGYSCIFQWDLCAGSATAIASTIYSISTGSSNPWQLQLAVNGKIYVSTLTESLACINSPNLPGAACGYSNVAVTYTFPSTTVLGLPNFVSNFFLTTPALSPFTFTNNCQEVNFTSPPQATADAGCSFATHIVKDIFWDFGEPSSGTANTSTLANPAHSYSTAGTYTVKLVFNYACSSDTVKIPVSVSSVATLSLTGFSTVCAKDKRIYTASGASSYSWSTGATTATIALTTTVNTTYTVTAFGSGPNPCVVTKTFKVTVAKCTGIEAEDASDTFFKVFPNPSHGTLNFETDKEVKVIITNALGQIVHEKSYSAGVHNLDISSYKDGIYFVKSTSGSSSKIKRLVKGE